MHIWGTYNIEIIINSTVHSSEGLWSIFHLDQYSITEYVILSHFGSRAGIDTLTNNPNTS